jgi:hypothetical protein
MFHIMPIYIPPIVLHGMDTGTFDQSKIEKVRKKNRKRKRKKK